MRLERESDEIGEPKFDEAEKPLFDLDCDWAAATLRHKDGDRCRTIETNIRKHRIEGPMAEIFRNTWRRYGGFCGQPASNFSLSAASVSAEGMAGR